ncbi:hypothetical protein WBG78_30305 [Chryseolinea sp. T2]|uniref:hypothetical protein n=1 Tax=Chryseolinea sp. T2 TaxID=3129255 RepID=UPI0030777B70
MSNTAKERAIEYAKNYPVANTDSGLFGPVSVSNIGSFNDRTMINLCLKTAKSSPRNASISFPSDWSKAKRFRGGDLVIDE